MTLVQPLTFSTASCTSCCKVRWNLCALGYCFSVAIRNVSHESHQLEAAIFHLVLSACLLFQLPVFDTCTLYTIHYTTTQNRAECKKKPQRNKKKNSRLAWHSRAIIALLLFYFLFLHPVTADCKCRFCQHCVKEWVFDSSMTTATTVDWFYTLWLLFKRFFFDPICRCVRQSCRVRLFMWRTMSKTV